MNNNITEDYCSFEVSKLLKEKGFKQSTLHYYFEDGEFRQNKLIETTGMDYGSEFTIEYIDLFENWNDNFLTKKDGSRCFGCSKSKGYLETFSSPTNSLAIKWIRENFGIHIHIESYGLGYYWKTDNTPDTKFWNTDFRHNQKVEHGSPCTRKEDPLEDAYKNYEEAVESALLYILKNLIL